MASIKQKVLKSEHPKRKGKKTKMKVLMCTNGKKNAEEAIAFGCNLFKGSKLNATILYVDSDTDTRSRQHLSKARKIALTYGIKAKTKIRLGDPTIKIIKESKEGNYDIVITGYKDLTNELKNLKEIFISKVIEDITKEITTSMLVVKSPRKIKKVLICTDGSKGAERAIKFFGSLKKDFKPQVDIVNVIPEVYHRFKDILEPLVEEQLKVFTKLPGERTKYLYKAKDLLSKYGIDANIILREGNFVEEIINLSEQGYDLIITGIRGMKLHKKKTMGRQTKRIIRNVQIPILAIK